MRDISHSQRWSPQLTESNERLLDPSLNLSRRRIRTVLSKCSTNAHASNLRSIFPNISRPGIRSRFRGFSKFRIHRCPWSVSSRCRTVPPRFSLVRLRNHTVPRYGRYRARKSWRFDCFAYFKQRSQSSASPADSCAILDSHSESFSPAFSSFLANRTSVPGIFDCTGILVPSYLHTKKFIPFVDRAARSHRAQAGSFLFPPKQRPFACLGSIALSRTFSHVGSCARVRNYCLSHFTRFLPPSPILPPFRSSTV